MSETTLSEHARQLVAQRRRATYTCAHCGKVFESVQRKQDAPRYCSANCRRKAWYRREHPGE